MQRSSAEPLSAHSCQSKDNHLDTSLVVPRVRSVRESNHGEEMHKTKRLGATNTVAHQSLLDMTEHLGATEPCGATEHSSTTELGHGRK